MKTQNKRVEEFWKTVREVIVEDIKSETIYLVSDENINNLLTQHHQDLISEVVEKLEGMKKPEEMIESCDNCGEEGYGKAWYGRGQETGDVWGDRYVPTGSVVFCKECKPNFRFGAEWNGEEIWKITSDSPEHDQLRISRITRTVNVEHNQALTEAQTIIKSK